MKFVESIKNLIYGPIPEDGEDEITPILEDDKGEETREAAPAPKAAPARTSNVSVSAGTSVEMKVVKPGNDTSLLQIADELLDGKTILLNLEDTNKEAACRIIDFLRGVSYAIGGHLNKVANCTYVITPKNVDISGEQLKEVKDDE